MDCAPNKQAIHKQQMMSNQARIERRADRRFPLTAEVDYRVTGESGQPTMGHGKTINISRRCVLIATGEPVPAGRHIELSIAWPARLDGTIALSFEVFGTTTHARGECIAVRILRYGFRTRRSRPIPNAFSVDKDLAVRNLAVHGMKGIANEPALFELQTRTR